MIAESRSELRKIPLIGGDVVSAGYSNNFFASQGIKTGDSFQFLIAPGGHFEYAQSSPLLIMDGMPAVKALRAYQNLCGSAGSEMPRFVKRIEREHNGGGGGIKYTAVSCTVLVEGRATLERVEAALRSTLTDLSDVIPTTRTWTPLLTSFPTRLESRSVEFVHGKWTRSTPWRVNDNLLTAMQRVNATTHLCTSRDEKRPLILASVAQIQVTSNERQISRFVMECPVAGTSMQASNLRITSECVEGLEHCRQVKPSKLASNLELTGDAEIRIERVLTCDRKSTATAGHPCNQLQD